VTDSIVAVVRDAEGTVFYAARHSVFVTTGLADGSLEEVPDAATDAVDGDDHDPGGGDGGSGDGKPPAGTEFDGDDEGMA
jgi:hypothetical protein